MTTGLVCPRCAAPLRPLRSRSIEMLGCHQCGGVWLDNASSKRVIDTLCDDTIDKSESLARFAQRPPDRAQDIACPSCRNPLQRWTVPEANVDVDWCGEHGTWFDKDELAVVARTYAARRAYGGGARVAGAAVAGAAVAGAVAAGAVVASDPSIADRAQRAVETHGEAALDVGLTALDYVDPADVVEGVGIAAEAAGVAAEAAGGLFGVLGEILGGL